MNERRKTSQDLAPLEHRPSLPGRYDLYPSFPVAAGKVSGGFEALANQLSIHKTVIVDGYGGVFWQDFRTELEQVFQARGLRSHWVCIDDALLPKDEIETLVKPFLEIGRASCRERV